MTTSSTTSYPVGDVGLPHLVYLTHEGTLTSICTHRPVLQSYDTDQTSTQRCWGWLYSCCCCHFNRTMKLSHAKGISKRLSEVYRSLYDRMLCGGEGGGGKDVEGNRVPGIYLETVGPLCQYLTVFHCMCINYSRISTPFGP